MQLVLRTVNSSRSAYACFIFKESFFEDYNAPGLPWAPSAAGPRDDATQPGTAAGTAAEAIRCKASSKVGATPSPLPTALGRTIRHPLAAHYTRRVLHSARPA